MTQASSGHARRWRSSASGSSEPANGKEREKPGLAARQAAVKLLAAVIDRHISLDGLVDPIGGNPVFVALNEADRALVKAILLTSLRHHGTLTARIDRLLDRPLPHGARSLRHILVSGAAQILYLDIPARAAVDLSVEIAARDPRTRRFSGLVNAVLRRIEDHQKKPESSLTRDPAGTVINQPKWFADRLIEVYGRDHAARIMAMLAFPAPLDLTAKGDPGLWAERLGGTVLPTGSVRLSGPAGPIAQMPGFAQGEWWVQDTAASLPVRLFGDLSGKHVADLCAAPGGKTAQLAHAGAIVTAVDPSASRLKRLAANLERLRLSAEIRQESLFSHKPQRLYDAVLLDAPCSSTGTSRRHPDIPWTKSPEDIVKLADLQARMLAHAATLVRPGGTIVFSNCSLDPLEGENMVRALLQQMPDLQRHRVPADALPGLEEAINDAGELRTTPAMLEAEPPETGGLDGFYAVRLVVS